MNLTECPFCYAPIHPLADGTCPACRKNTRTAPPENFQYTAAELSADQDFPACCILCGQDTENIELFVFSYDSHLGDRLDDAAYFAFLMFSVLTVGLGLFLLPLYRRRLRNYRQMTYAINLPFCPACLPAKPAYAPITIEGSTYHFKVHKSFKAKLPPAARGSIR
ncbi:hypothetical protein [Noviherbaspirillum sedimenti]|uniref:Uncharacterized protein n=1 Tax=Noviherbaspirillum sedimenti TaxID=2320865 RepID=A0A3A3G2Y6_9BURK|nr:hypothetical protein [Noviherbaspirillum sedimenti]RJG02858.1 hypothetical protein D3878_15775 [Noviherbaspirillum sedimenti]